LFVVSASAAAISASTKMCDYVASKFAVYGLNESLRLDLARRGVKGVHTTVRLSPTPARGVET
jgi:short-subunit dehydrogenase